jgi:hypothetical protein
MRTGLIVRFGIPAALAGASLLVWKLQAGEAQPADRKTRSQSEPSRAAEGSQVRAPLFVAPLARPKPAEETPVPVTGREAPVDEPVSHEEVLFREQERFAGIPLDPARQIKNERALEGMFERLKFIDGLKANEFECRGPSCRAVLKFNDLEQAKSVLNNLPQDPDWDRQKFGFSAIEEDPEHHERLRYVVYFTSAT